MLFNNRTPLATWFHLIQTTLSSGHSKVIATVCSRPSLEKIQASLENVQKNKVPSELYRYTIDPAPVYEPNRRCDICNCS